MDGDAQDGLSGARGMTPPPGDMELATGAMRDASLVSPPSGEGDMPAGGMPEDEIEPEQDDS